MVLHGRAAKRAVGDSLENRFSRRLREFVWAASKWPGHSAPRAPSLADNLIWLIAVLDRISCVIALASPICGAPVMKKLFALIVLFCVGLTHASEPPAKLYAVSDGCGSTSCNGRHAIVFVHGIYGGEDTFVNTSVSPAFSWPRSIASTVAGKSVDVYRLEYRTELLAWSRRNVAELDEVDSTVLPLLTALRGRGYESVNFIAHSLGGNVV